jgi:hypothetical protein
MFFKKLWTNWRFFKFVYGLAVPSIEMVSPLTMILNKLGLRVLDETHLD